MILIEGIFGANLEFEIIPDDPDDAIYGWAFLLNLLFFTIHFVQLKK